MEKKNEEIENLESLFRAAYSPNGKKILSALYEISKNQWGTTYRNLLEVTGLGIKEADFTLKSLQKEGLCKVYNSELSTNALKSKDILLYVFVDPTDAGIIIGRSYPKD